MGLPGLTDLHADLAATLAASRAALLEELGEGHELTFVTGPGNLGDDLVRAGTRSLLAGRIYNEITVDQLAAAAGDVALLVGGGRWGRSDHEVMPRALAVAELRFERVIVLPSSFDVAEDAVRRALERTRATVFAREHESFRRIEGLCRARLAHDCAFFFDFSRFSAAGSGTLNALRHDPEALPEGDLDGWLAAIERHADVRTDQAHVLIAAALMGKTVEYAPGSYLELDALAESWLRGFPVTRIESPRIRRRPPDQAAGLRAELSALSDGAPFDPVSVTEPVTAVILTRDRADQAQNAVESVLRAGKDVSVLLIANNPSSSARARLDELAASEPRVRLRVLDRNLGCAGGRRLASEIVDGELILFLDDDAELIGGALERMRADLAAHPDAAGVTALVVGADGRVQHCGGTVEWTDESVRFHLGGNGLRHDDPQVPPSGRSDWLPGTAALIRAQALGETPLDPALASYYEDNDWSLRIEGARPGSLRRCREAIALHHGGGRPESETCELARVFDVVELLASQAAFLARHGAVLDVDLVALLPQLKLTSGRPDIAAVRLLLELVAARGVEWVACEWLGGRLAPLFEPGPNIESLRRSLDERAHQLSVATAAHAELAEYVQILRLEIAEEREKVDWLLQRHETLRQVEQGRYWRGRRKLLAGWRLASRLAGRAGR
jgi:GT2 family glycosyltransferase